MRAPAWLGSAFLVFGAVGLGACSRRADIVGTRGADATTPSPCTGKPGVLKGKTDHDGFDAGDGGSNRHFILYVPESLDSNAPAPIVFVPHGHTMSAQAMYDLTAYPAKADEEEFIAVFPTGETGDDSDGPAWNVGAGICGEDLTVLGLGDDQAFMEAIIDFIEADRCVDRDHIFMTGFSLGGYFAHETACVNARFRAIGAHSAGTHDLSSCSGSPHKPVIMFHGAVDPYIPTCGAAARDEWVRRNGCGTTTRDVNVTGGHCEYSNGCPTDGQVVLCTFDRMGHAWAGGIGEFGDPAMAKATDLGWEFFKQYAW